MLTDALATLEASASTGNILTPASEGLRYNLVYVIDKKYKIGYTQVPWYNLTKFIILVTGSLVHITLIFIA